MVTTPNGVEDILNAHSTPFGVVTHTPSPKIYAQIIGYQTNNMKIQYLFPLLTLVVFLACNTVQKAQTPPASTNPPVTNLPAETLAKEVRQSAPSFVTWDKKMVDLGKVKKGEKRTLFFELTNTSGQEIQIEIVDACECTKVDFPRGPIAPGGKGRFDVIFDSTEKDAPETIGITVVFQNTDAAGNPRIETVEYKFGFEK